MEKLNLHDSLRIYLPGLILAGLIYFIIYLTVTDIQLIFIPAIFLSFILNGMIYKSHRKLFEKIIDKPIYLNKVEKANFFDAWKKILRLKIKSMSDNSSLYILELYSGKVLYSHIATPFFTKKYESADINCFRSPKSFGIMFYNLSLVCIIALIFTLAIIPFKIFISKYGFRDLLPYFMIFISLSVSYFILYRNSRDFFFRSLNQEFNYWKSINQSEVKEIIELLNISVKIHAV